MVPLRIRVEDREAGSAEEYTFSRSPVRIGRSSRNELCLARPFVSAWHARIDFGDGPPRYTDLGSTNGTLLNGVTVEARAAVPLEPGAEIGIGSLVVTFPDAVAAERAPSPRLAPGGITAVMRQLAVTPSIDLERAWRQVYFPGAIIGRFELLREIGRGSFGLVFEARDRQLGRLVAFKAVKPGRESQVMLREELLQKEAEAVAQLNHPNIVSLYDAGTCDGGPYLILELLHGETLRERIRRAPMALKEAVEIAIEMAWALDHAHSASVIHRDLKPANVFLCTGGRVKVLDFGIAHVFGSGAIKAVGTPAYMAPEQWRRAREDERTDVFGAAATLAEMVTGRLPYRVTQDSSEVLDRGAKPYVSAPGVPRRLVALLRSALHPDPEQRPADGHMWLAELLEVHEALDETPALGVRPPRGTPPPHAPVTERPAPRRRAAATVIAGALAAGGLGALAYFLLR